MNSRIRQCGKAAWITRKIACDMAQKLGKRDGIRLEPYKCAYCGSFHLTSMTKAMRKQVKAYREERMAA